MLRIIPTVRFVLLIFVITYLIIIDGYVPDIKESDEPVCDCKASDDMICDCQVSGERICYCQVPDRHGQLAAAYAIALAVSTIAIIFQAIGPIDQVLRIGANIMGGTSGLLAAMHWVISEGYSSDEHQMLIWLAIMLALIAIILVTLVYMYTGGGQSISPIHPPGDAVPTPPGPPPDCKDRSKTRNILFGIAILGVTSLASFGMTTYHVLRGRHGTRTNRSSVEIIHRERRR